MDSKSHVKGIEHFHINIFYVYNHDVYDHHYVVHNFLVYLHNNIHFLYFQHKNEFDIEC